MQTIDQKLTNHEAHLEVGLEGHASHESEGRMKTEITGWNYEQVKNRVQDEDDEEHASPSGAVGSGEQLVAAELLLSGFEATCDLH